MLRYLIVLLLAALVTACSGERRLSCEDPERYAASGTVGPIRVPDDLSPPDESDALVIPQVPQTELAGAATGRCLETPPDFFEGQGAG